MTDEQINEAIAEACGWTVIKGVLCAPKPEVRHGMQTGDVEMNPIGNVPSYTTDLNAMHEAEKTLTDAEWHAYFDELVGMVCGSVSSPAHMKYPKTAGATAYQRAVTFVRTKGLRR